MNVRVIRMVAKYDIDLIISRFLSGEATGDDIVILSDWL